jgi:hypothetical protein
VGPWKPKVPEEVAKTLRTWGREEDTMAGRASPAALLREVQRACDQRLTEVFHSGAQLRTGGPGGVATVQMTAITGLAMPQHGATAQTVTPGQTMMPVFSEYQNHSNSFISLNAAMHTSDQMLHAGGRTCFTNPEAGREIIYEVVRAWSGKADRREDVERIINDVIEGAIPRGQLAERIPPPDSDWSRWTTCYGLYAVGFATCHALGGRTAQLGLG